ncbi:MAG TPA: hypothetical protein VN666_06065 [Nitrospira sp.]|nr:hypothetical protein [Nitrospira sp.]
MKEVFYRAFPTLIHLTALTHLEGQIRAAKTIQELQFLSVNETRRLIPYDEAFLLILSSSSPDKEAYRVLNASSVAVVDRDAPLIVWLEQAVQALRRPGNTSGQPMVVTEELLPDSLHSGWREFMKEHVFWCPLQHPDETVLGAWWFERDFAWQKNDVAIVHRLAGSYAVCMEGLVEKGTGLVQKDQETGLVASVDCRAGRALFADPDFRRGSGQSHGEGSGGDQRAHGRRHRGCARAAEPNGATGRLIVPV